MVQNKLIVTGDGNLIDSFMAFARGTECAFLLKPLSNPPDPATGDIPDQAQAAFWSREKNTKCEYIFSTKECAPVAWLRQAAWRFPGLHFRLKWRSQSTSGEVQFERPEKDDAGVAAG